MAEPLNLDGTDLTMDDFRLCATHDKWCLIGYPCWECQEDWRKAHPERAKAISDFVAGRIGHARVRQILSRTDN